VAVAVVAVVVAVAAAQVAQEPSAAWPPVASRPG
jgi:hypothetical protein